MATSVASRVDPPVVITSSTTSTRSAADSVNPRRSVSTPVLPLGEDRAHAERAPDLLADDDAAERRREHGRRLQVPRPLGDACAERLGELGELEHERALQIAVAVQPG